MTKGDNMFKFFKRKKHKEPRPEQVVEDFLWNAPGRKSLIEIGRGLGMTKSQVTDALKQLESEGRVDYTRGAHGVKLWRVI